MKVPVSEYIAHLQTLDLEGRIKYLLDKAESQGKNILANKECVEILRESLEALSDAETDPETAEEVKSLRSMVDEHSGAVEALTQRCNIHEEALEGVAAGMSEDTSADRITVLMEEIRLLKKEMSSMQEKISAIHSSHQALMEKPEAGK